MPANVDVDEEENARFECHVSGLPKPNVTWSINGVPVDCKNIELLFGLFLLSESPDELDI